MTRVRFNENGIAIAKPGYDVDIAPLSKIQFSPLFTCMRLAIKGTVTVADFTGYMGDRYRRAIITFAIAFSKPPIVMAAGQISGGGVDMTNITGTIASNTSGQAWHEPIYQIVTSTTQFELYVNKSWGGSGRTTSWRYWVFRNTVED